MSTEPQRDPERELEQLFAHAQPREAPPPADEAQIQAAVYAEWNELMGRRGRVRRFTVGAAAAAVGTLAVLVGVNVYRTPAPVLVATIERFEGAVRIAGADGERLALAPGVEISTGAIIETGSGGAALALGGDGSLRLGANSELTLLAPAEVELITGVVYFDSEGSATALTIRTPLGAVRDVGTQFFARVGLDRLEVGVRDGRVAVARETAQAEVDAGEKLSVLASGAASREPLAPYGGEWEWVERLAPPFDADGRSVLALTEWVAEQTGREVAFATPEAERSARTAILRGSIDGAPLPKLEGYLATADFAYTLVDGTILIRTR